MTHVILAIYWLVYKYQRVVLLLYSSNDNSGDNHSGHCHKVWKKAKEKCEKILVVAGDSNPGPPALATGALTTEL